MRVVEFNRIIEYCEDDKRVSDKIVEGLEFILGPGVEITDNENLTRFHENMKKYFPDPVSRVKILKQLVISECNEESDEDDEEAKVQETEFFLRELLSSIVQIVEKSDSVDDCVRIMEGLL